MVDQNQIKISFPQQTGRLPLTFSLGQRFIANVRKSPHGLILEFGKNRLPARATTTLTDGDRLLLEVADIKQDLILRVIEHFGQQPALHQTLRQAIPRQGSAEQLIEAICRIRTQSLTDVAPNSFIRSLPTLQDLSRPGNFSQVYYNSGLFCEHKIASPTTPADLTNDVKVQLLRWIRQLRSTATPSNPIPMPAIANPTPSPVELSEAVTIKSGRDKARPNPHARPHLSETAQIQPSAEAFLQRITALQIRLALHEQTDWTLELPFRDAEGLGSTRLRIRSSSDPAQPEERAFTLDVTLQLPAAEPMYVALLLRGKTIDCAWWCPCARTTAALKSALPQFRQRLTENGFEQCRINIQQGWPNHDPTAPSAEIPPGMIHEQA